MELVAIFKGGKKRRRWKTGDYRGIALIDVIGKVLERGDSVPG